MKRYRKPTIVSVSMMTVKEHNWLRRASPFMYGEWMKVGARILKELAA